MYNAEGDTEESERLREIVATPSLYGAGCTVALSGGQGRSRGVDAVAFTDRTRVTPLLIDKQNSNEKKQKNLLRLHHHQLLLPRILFTAFRVLQLVHQLQTMGNFFAKLFDRWGVSEQKILMLGLDAAGKTTVLYKLQLGEVMNTIPTIGFNVETVRYKKIEFNIWDVGGQDKIRSLWRHYYENTDGLIFVVDSNDQSRIKQAQAELRKLITQDELQGAKVLVLANKQDLPHAVPPAALAEKLELSSMKQDWYIQGCSAVSGAGLFEGLDWLSSSLKSK